MSVALSLREYAGRTWPDMNHKGRIAMLARRLGFGHRRIRSLYSNEPGVSLRAEEAAAIAALRQDKGVTQNEFQNIAERLARVEAYLAASDPHFHSGQMAALRALLDEGRGQDGTGRS